MPILAVSLGFSDDDKPALLSAYSSGYILTQIGGGFLADRYGAYSVISSTVGVSAFILLFITRYTSAVIWMKAFFCLGLVAGPLFPAGSTAISAYVPSEKRAAAAAIVDAAAAAGTTVAALAPMIAAQFGWRLVYYVTAVALAVVSIGSLSLSSSKKLASVIPTLSNNNLASASHVEKYPFAALLSPAALSTYICHSADNFTKYSVNAWAATMLFEKHGASPTMVGAILASQEAVGVASRLFVGTSFSNDATSSFSKRGWTSAIAFGAQGLAQFAAFRAPTPTLAAAMFVVSAIAVGAHSVGFRPIYFEASPDHAGSVSGLGNTVASLASAIGPVLIGSIKGWSQVGLVMFLVNLGGAAAALTIARVGRTRTRKLHLSQ